jgi:hypothetical protein
MNKKLLGILAFLMVGNFSEGFSMKTETVDSRKKASLLGSNSSHKMINSLVTKKDTDKSPQINKKTAVNAKLQDWIDRLAVYADIFQPTITQTRLDGRKNYDDMVDDIRLMTDNLSTKEIVNVLKALENQTKTKNLISILVNPLILFNIKNDKIDENISDYLVRSLQGVLQFNPSKRITFIINTLEEYLMNPNFLSSLIKDPLAYSNFNRFVNVTMKQYIDSDMVASMQYWELIQKIKSQQNINLASKKSKAETQKSDTLTKSQKLYQDDLDGLAFGRDGNYDDPMTDSQRNKKDSDELPFANGGSYNDPTEKEKYDSDLDGLAFGRDGNYDDDIAVSKNKKSGYVDPFAKNFASTSQSKKDSLLADDESTEDKKQPISFVRRIGNKMQNCRCVCDGAEQSK